MSWVRLTEEGLTPSQAVASFAVVGLAAGALAARALAAGALAAGLLAIVPSEVKAARLGIVEEQEDAPSGHLLSFRVPASTLVRANSLVEHIQIDAGYGSSRHSLRGVPDSTAFQ